MTTPTPTSFLRTTLLANALFTALCGLALVIMPGRLATLIGAVGATPLLIIGVVLLLYAVDLGRTALGGTMPRGRIAYFIGMDLLWVLGSVVVLWVLAVPFTPAGHWIVLLIADAVGLFGILQYVGLRRLGRPASGTASAEVKAQ